MELAAEEPAGIPIDLNARIDEFLCRALRGEPASWDTLGPIDSEVFLSRCRHHGIVALLFHRLHESGTWNGWPPELRHEFEKASKAGVAHDLLRAHYLKQLVSRLSEQGIPCILLKGEALAASMYEEPGVRTRSPGQAQLHRLAPRLERTGPFAERIVQGLLTTPQAVAQFVRGYADAGCDNLILFPVTADLAQLHQLADVIA